MSRARAGRAAVTRPAPARPALTRTGPVRRLPARFRPLVRALAAAGIVVAVVAHLGTVAVVDGLRAVGPTAVLAALGIGLLTIVLNAWRWCLVARGLGLRLALPAAVAHCYRAALLNAVLPAGVLGDVHRAVDHGRRAGDVARGVRAVAVERCIGFAVLLVVGVGVLVANPALIAALSRGTGPVVTPGPLALVVAVLIAVAAVGVVSVAAARHRLRTTGAGMSVRRLRAAGMSVPRPRAAGMSGPRLRAAVGTMAARARSAVLGPWPAVVALSALALAGYLALFVVAARAAGSQAPLGDLLPLLVVALAAMGLPVNVGGWGPREATASLAFGAVGLDPAQGLAVAVVYGVLSLVACLPGVAVLLLPRLARHGRPAPGDQRPGAPGSQGNTEPAPVTSLAPC